VCVWFSSCCRDGDRSAGRAWHVCAEVESGGGSGSGSGSGSSERIHTSSPDGNGNRSFRRAGLGQLGWVGSGLGLPVMRGWEVFIEYWVVGCGMWAVGCGLWARDPRPWEVVDAILCFCFPGLFLMRERTVDGSSLLAAASIGMSRS
jgi:hypothetical protein